MYILILFTMIKILTYYHLEASLLATSIADTVGGYTDNFDSYIHPSELARFDYIDYSIPLARTVPFKAIRVLNSNDELIGLIGYFKNI